MNKIKVFIADDHPVVRSGIRAAFSGRSGYEVVGEAGDGAEALSQILSLKPDIAVMDITMPGLSGIAAAKKVSESNGPTKIIIVSMHADAYNVIDAFRAGARGYVLKDAPQEELLKAVETVHQGGKFVSPAAAGELLTDFADKRKGEISDPVDTLSQREREVLKMIAEGRKSSEIAEKLFISVSTVKSHRNNIMKKLNIRDTAGLVKTAIRKGMVRP